MCSNSSLKSLSQLKTKFTWDHHGIGEKIYSNDSGQLLFFILILSAPGAGAFSEDFTTNLARQCRALKIEKLKAPLFRGPEGAGATNDWCIISTAILPLPPIQEEPMSVNGERICAKYWLSAWGLAQEQYG